MLHYIKYFCLFIMLNFANLSLLSVLWVKKKIGDVGLESIYFTLKTPFYGIPNRLLFSYSKRIFFFCFSFYNNDICNLLFIKKNKIKKIKKIF
jgi:hypothetical protein